MHLAFGLLAVFALSPPLAAGPQPAPCADLLARLADAAAARGYAVTLAGPRLTGTRPGSGLVAACGAGHLDLEIQQTDGSAAVVEFDGLAPGGPLAAAFAIRSTLEIAGVGRLEHEAHIEDAADSAIHGALHFEAVRYGGAAATVALDLASGEWIVTGEPGLAEAQLAPHLASSPLGADQQRLVVGLAGALALGAQFSVANPGPTLAPDKDAVNQVKVCATALTLCGASWWFPPAIGGCVSWSAACAVAMACSASDCEGDG